MYSTNLKNRHGLDNAFLKKVNSNMRPGNNQPNHGFWARAHLEEIFPQEARGSGSEPGESDWRKSNDDKTKLRTAFDYNKQKILWWSPRQNSLPVEFSQNSSLHGLKYIGQPKRHLSERIFWIISFTIGVFMAGFLIAQVYIKYMSNPFLVSFVPLESHVKDVPFPAITICNMNKVRKSKAGEYMNTANGNDSDERVSAALKNVYYLNHVCSTTNSFSKQFNYSNSLGKISDELLEKIADYEVFGNRTYVKEFLADASQPCSSMVPMCSWRGVMKECNKKFRPVETDFGKCCTFNMVPQTLIHRYLNDSRDNSTYVALWENSNLEMDDLLLDITDESVQQQPTMNVSTFPRRARLAGQSFGLSILLQPEIPEYFCTTSDSTGFRLAIHLPIDIPHVVDSGIAIAPNSEVFVSIRPDATIASNDIRSYPLETRQCYLKGEYSLTFYTLYSSSNCIDECISNRTHEACTCVRYFMPRADTWDLCNPEDYNCTDNVVREFITKPVKEFCSQCYPTCTEISYISVLTSTTLQTPNMTDKQGGEGHDNLPIHKNASIVHIYFGEETFYPKVRKRLYDSTDLIANSGGLLGLCLGFSVLSAVEFLYFITLHLWCKFRRNKDPTPTEDIRKGSRIALDLKKRREAASGRMEEVYQN